jgi:Flp pilus assembly protein TadD
MVMAKASRTLRATGKQTVHDDLTRARVIFAAMTTVSPPADLASAISHHQAGRLADAEALYRRALASNPADIDALRLLGVLRFQCGDSAEAESRLRHALQIAPGHAKAHDNLGFVLSGLGRREDAFNALRRAVELEPGNAAFQFNLASLLVTMQRMEEAADAFNRVLALEPGHTGAHQQLATALLRRGDGRKALHHLDACVRHGLATSGVHAHRAIALTQIGDLEALHRLVDFDGLVKPAHIGDGHGFASLAEFNRLLAAHVVENVTLHEDKTTVHGLDTKEILESPLPAIAALKRFIYSQIEARLRDLPEAGHPFTAGAPHQWRTMSWGVKMWREGYQVPHIHHKAWLSGVYYVQLPEVVTDGQVGHEGWIEFGRAPTHLYASAEPPVRLIRPIEGMMLSFPSYVWHRTIPFEGTRDRISIAFDVIATE